MHTLSAPLLWFHSLLASTGVSRLLRFPLLFPSLIWDLVLLLLRWVLEFLWFMYSTFSDLACCFMLDGYNCSFPFFPFFFGWPSLLGCGVVVAVVPVVVGWVVHTYTYIYDFRF
jgi:hypothetical protein